MILNKNTNWGQVGAIVTGSNPTTFVRDAFKGQFAKPVDLWAGYRLYKFNNDKNLIKPGNEYLSEWWSPYTPFEHDPGWAGRQKLAANLRVSIRELGRVTSAVKENWNSLAYLLVITLKYPVTAYFGGFAQMVRIDPTVDKKKPVKSKVMAGEGRGRSQNLPGGGTQFYIPRLPPNYAGEWRVLSLL